MTSLCQLLQLPQHLPHPQAVRQLLEGQLVSPHSTAVHPQQGGHDAVTGVGMMTAPVQWPAAGRSPGQCQVSAVAASHPPQTPAEGRGQGVGGRGIRHHKERRNKH